MSHDTFRRPSVAESNSVHVAKVNFTLDGVDAPHQRVAEAARSARIARQQQQWQQQRNECRPAPELLALN
jgi:hypothetical protein